MREELKKALDNRKSSQVAFLKAKLASGDLAPEDVEVVNKVIKGLEDIENGDVISHEEARERLSKKFESGS